MANTSISKKTHAEAPRNNFAFAFGPINYILMLVGIVLLVIGYILLGGGGSDDPNVFNSAMFDTRRLVVSPIMITVGLIIEIVAIMLKTNKKDNQKAE